MPGGDEQPIDKGIMRTLMGNDLDDGRGLIVIGWFGHGTLDEFRRILCDPARIQALADHVKELGEKAKEAEARRAEAGKKA